MIDIQVKLGGDIEAALTRYEARVKQQALLSGVAEAARIIYDEVLLNAVRGGPSFPDRQSGELEKNIYRAYVPDASTDEKKVYIVGARSRSKAFYWSFLEFGTSKMPAQPFIRPAAAHLSRALEAGKQRMAERLKEG